MTLVTIALMASYVESPRLILDEENSVYDAQGQSARFGTALVQWSAGAACGPSDEIEGVSLRLERDGDGLVAIVRNQGAKPFGLRTYGSELEMVHQLEDVDVALRVGGRLLSPLYICGTGLAAREAYLMPSQELRHRFSDSELGRLWRPEFGNALQATVWTGKREALYSNVVALPESLLEEFCERAVRKREAIEKELRESTVKSQKNSVFPFWSD